MADTATTQAALRTGKIDMMLNITLQDATSLQKSNPELKYASIIQPGQAFPLRADREPFSDIKVRQALQLALNLPEISNGYYGDTSGPTPVSFINPYMCKGFTLTYDEWPQELQEEYTYNPEKAKQLLADAGYPNGFDVTCDVFKNVDVQFGQVAKAYFQDIGVNVNLELYDESVLMNMIGAKKHDDMVQWTYSCTMPPLMAIQMYAPNEPTNPISQDDTAFAQMIKDSSTAASLEEAQQQLSNLDQHFLKQHWLIITFVLNQYNFWQPYLKGYSSEKGNLAKGYYAREWIDQDQKQSLGR